MALYANVIARSQHRGSRLPEGAYAYSQAPVPTNLIHFAFYNYLDSAEEHFLFQIIISNYSSHSDYPSSTVPAIFFIFRAMRFLRETSSLKGLTCGQQIPVFLDSIALDHEVHRQREES